jgi:AcrR family transcriptional regulator
MGDGPEEDRQRPRPRRKRGHSAGLDRARIIEAARGIPLRDLTMQAIADRLGVDRSALNYHVADRQALLELVAEDSFAAYLSPAGITQDTGWREGCLLLARATRDSVIATGQFAYYMRLSSPPGADALRPVEMVLEKMCDAGFGLETAARGLYALSALAIALARGQLAARENGVHPQIPETKRALESASADGGVHPLLARLFESGGDVFDDPSFDASIGIFIDGLGLQIG